MNTNTWGEHDIDDDKLNFNKDELSVFERKNLNQATKDSRHIAYIQEQ